MKAFIVVSCLVLAVVAKPQGYTYEKPSNNGLSVTLLLPPSQNQHIPSSFPALTQYSGHSASQGYAGSSSHQSLGVGSHSAGGSLSLGSSYSVSPTVNTFSPHSFGGSSFGSSGSSFGSGASSSGHSFGSGVSSSSLGSGSSFAGVVAAPAAPAPTPSFVPSPVAPTFVPAAPAPAPSFAPAVSAPSFTPAVSAPSFAAAVSAPSFAPSFAPSPAAPVANTLVQKHIYVHVPPPDEEELAAKNRVVAPVQAQKHYKIIFIKAPSGPSVAQQLAQAQLAQQQSEEKTLVYVLVKKPESLEELQNSIPRVPLQQPSKPEVYFIKYKAQTEGGVSAPVPLSQPIGLSAPSSTAQTLEFQGLPSTSSATDFQSSSFDSSSSSGFGSSSSLSSSSVSSGSSVDATASTSVDDSSSSVLSGSDAANIAAVIQPRTPAPEYGVPRTPAAEYGPPKQ